IKMPGVDGIEATQQIKALYPTIEVIMLTAYGKFSYSQQAIKAQVGDYLLKPIQPQQLIKAVAEALDRLSLKRFQPGPAVDLAGVGEQVRLANLGEAKRELALILEYMTQGEGLYSFGWRLLVIVGQAALSAGAKAAEVTEVEQEMAKALSHVSSLESIQGWGESLIEKCMGLAKQDRNTHDLILVRQVMEYIEAHYVEDVSLTTVAAHVHLSPAYLSRIFSKKVGTGFSDYVVSVRLKAGKQRLQKFSETIDQIASALGFSSSSYFSSVFKKYEGVTPSEYRAKRTS
ncbi:MAG: response regulator transcription factor, partial [Desulfitobacteriaceae bacterium]